MNQNEMQCKGVQTQGSNTVEGSENARKMQWNDSGNAVKMQWKGGERPVEGRCEAV